VLRRWVNQGRELPPASLTRPEGADVQAQDGGDTGLLRVKSTRQGGGMVKLRSSWGATDYTFWKSYVALLDI